MMTPFYRIAFLGALLLGGTMMWPEIPPRATLAMGAPGAAIVAPSELTQPPVSICDTDPDGCNAGRHAI